MHSSIVWISLTLVTGVWAQQSYLAAELSFGQEPRISTDLRNIPNFKIVGEPASPGILSNKIILTPPAPGNQRGAVWTEKVLQNVGWTADIDFRSTGPERGGGKMTIWLVQNGYDQVKTSSIYTVGKFDGLALTIDTYAGTAGTIRGFLNDGNTEYKSHHSVDSLAFGHCAYSYRNLGRLSRLKLTQSKEKFQVSIDDKVCFESSKIKVPPGYNFGITAVSGENPDSFEVNRLVVTTEKYAPDSNDKDVPAGGTQSETADRANSIVDPLPLSNSASTDDPPEVDADKVDTTRHFADLHNRLQALMKHVSYLERSHREGRDIAEQKLSAIHHMLSKQQYGSGSSASSGSETKELLGAVDKRIEAMDNKISELARQIDHIKFAVGDKGHFEDLKRTVNASHSSLLSAAPKHGLLIFIILGSQAVLVAGYVYYERRKVSSSKKYL